MRILEGAGPRGLAGIPARRGRIVRPLLDVDRATVQAHLVAHGLEAVEDATNRDTDVPPEPGAPRAPAPPDRAGGRSHVPAALRRVARASREAVEALDALVRPRLAGHLTPDARGLAARPRRLRRPSRRRGEGRRAPRPRRGRVGRPARRAACARRTSTRWPRWRGRAPGRGCGCRGASSSSAAAMPSGSCGRRPPARARRAPRPGPPPGGGDGGRDGRGGSASAGSAGRSGLGGLVRRRRARPRPGHARVALGGSPRSGRAGPGSAWCRSAEPTPCGSRSSWAVAGVPRQARARWPVVARENEVLWLLGVRRGATAPLTATTRTMLRLHAAPPRPPGLPDGDTV